MGESKWGEMTDTPKTFQTIWQNGEPVEAAKTRARANPGVPDVMCISNCLMTGVTVWVERTKDMIKRYERVWYR